MSNKDRHFGIVDYGLGNLRSIARSFEFLDQPVQILSDPRDFERCHALVLPGVGAFPDGMNNLKTRGFEDPLGNFIQQGRPILGICLGLQLLMTRSHEFGVHQGLNIIQGDVIPLPIQTGLKIPHIGWSSLKVPSYLQDSVWDHTPLQAIPKDSDVYFVHSYVVQPDDRSIVLATSFFGNYEFCAFLKRDNIFGCQFHPEKSGKVGLRILKDFVNCVGGS